ncbi:GvpL/GvpF family gas vesicle protein [Geotalea uraniireducens]|uniref:Gas vesicle synthesis GvpLGvpF n=1 Tax=Geotalea uraniireducens (strain Rf4) TaxID=351605 RepID=A5G5D1_GEOUR|nr:GvpL/GvpF family gas vesicle protein [Geotalea uraniireducens]ABQ26999.1 Gas vesicle synthesis GvpLGvpF [Geotalea uraniireducens Rf4]
MEGRYIYCVAEGDEEISLGRIGIDGSEVYTVHFEGLSAIVHNYQGDPPDCWERESMIGWVVSHQKVVETAWRRFGTILPVRFHTVIKGGADDLNGWLGGNHGELRKSIGRLRGREEYGVQVFWDEDLVAGRLVDSVPALRELKAKTEGGTGAAYMHGQLLEKALKREMAREKERYFENIYQRIEELAERIIIEEVKAADNGVRMIMNLSVLVPGERRDEMTAELEIINLREGIAVRPTGPWPPYSFVDM